MSEPAATLVDPQRESTQRSLAIVYLVGVPLACLWLALPHRGDADDLALLAVITANGLLGGMLVVWHRLDFGLAVAATNASVALGVYLTGVPDSGFALFFLWLTPYAFGVLTLRNALLQTGLVAIFYGIALIAVGDAGAGYSGYEGVGRWVLTVGTIVVLGLLLRRAITGMRESDERFQRGFEAAPVGMALVGRDGRWIDVNDSLCRLLGRGREELIGEPVDDLRHPEAGRPAVDPAAGVDFEKPCMRPDGSLVWAGVTVTSIRDETGAVRYSLWQVIDLTERRRVEEQRSAQDGLRMRRVRELELLAELTRMALEGRDVSEVLELSAQGVGEVLDAEIVGLIEPADDGKAMRLHSGSRKPRDMPSPSVPTGRSLAAHTLALGEPVVSGDLLMETRFTAPPELLDAGIRSAMTVPVVVGERTFGAYAAASLAKRTFTAEDVNFVQSVGNLIAVALQAAEAHESLAELAGQRGRLVAEALKAEESTRRAISELLHERALQELLAAHQDVGEAIRHPDRAGTLERASEGLERAVDELRSAVFELHPLALTHGGLRSALEGIARAQSRRGGFEYRIEIGQGAEGVHDQLLLGVARELLTNATKHSQARHVEVRLHRRDGRIELSVLDDGRGMASVRPDKALEDGHIGLASTAQRVEAVGGSLDIDSAGGRGTCVTAALPVNASP